MPPLPTDILEHIFPHLPSRRRLSFEADDDQRRDKTDLLSASLVSRRWRDTARRHIFHTTTCAFNRVHITDPEPEEDDGAPVKRSLEEFAEFLRSVPDVCRLIRRLNLVSIGALIDGSRHVERGLVHSMLFLLPEIQYLMLDRFVLYVSNPTPPAVRFAISTLELCQGSDENNGAARAVMTAINMFERIDSLRITNYYIDDDFYRAASAFPATRVASLVLDTLPNSPLLQCVDSRYVKALRLPSFLFGNSSTLAGSDWWKNLSQNAFGRQIEHLGFYFFEGGDPEYCAALLSLCPRLQSVTIAFADRQEGWGAWHTNPKHPLSTFIRLMPIFVPSLVFECGSAFEHNDPLSSAELMGMETALAERFRDELPKVALRVREGSLLHRRQKVEADDFHLGGISIPAPGSDMMKALLAFSTAAAALDDPDDFF